MSRMVIDDGMWSRLEKLLPKPKGCHGKDDRLFMEAIPIANEVAKLI